jgi:hypothetical protein
MNRKSFFSLSALTLTMTEFMQYENSTSKQILSESMRRRHLSAVVPVNYFPPNFDKNLYLPYMAKNTVLEWA